MEIPATEGGVVKEIKVKMGDKVSTGDVIVVLDTDAKAAPAEKSALVEKKEPKKAEKRAEKKPKKTKPIVAEIVDEEDEDDVEEETKSSKVLSGTVQTDSDVHAGPGVRRSAIADCGRDAGGHFGFGCSGHLRFGSHAANHD